LRTSAWTSARVRRAKVWASRRSVP
jgi:hypothetical protein